MLDTLTTFFSALEAQTGLSHFWWGNAVMIAIGAVMIYLGVAKRYEPLLLIGIGFACIVFTISFRPSCDLRHRFAGRDQQGV